MTWALSKGPRRGCISRSEYPALSLKLGLVPSVEKGVDVLFLVCLLLKRLPKLSRRRLKNEDSRLNMACSFGTQPMIMHHPTPSCCICKFPFDNASQRPHVAYAGGPVGQRLDLQGPGTYVAGGGYLTTSNTTTPPSRLICRCFCLWSQRRDLASTLNFLLSLAVFYCYATGIGHAPLLGVHASQCWHSWPAAETALLNSSQQVWSTWGCSLSFVPSDEAGSAQPCLANAVCYAVSRSSAANSPNTCPIVSLEP